MKVEEFVNSVLSIKPDAKEFEALGHSKELTDRFLTRIQYS